MNDYISRQVTIDALGERPMVWTSDDDYALGERNQYDIDRLAIETVPSADAVEVVRCRDCKYWHDAPAADGFNSCEMDALIRHEGFFCANGERKDGEQNE